MDHWFSIRAACPACGGQRRRTIFSAPFTSPELWPRLTTWYPAIVTHRAGFEGHDYAAEECMQCQLIYQRELPSDALLAELYGSWLPAHRHPRDDSAFQFDIAHPRITRPGQELHHCAAMLGKQVGELRTFDFGMGWGHFAICSAALGAQSYGYDLSLAGCTYAADRGVTVAALADLPSLQVDLLSCDQTLEHVPNPRVTLEQIVQAVVPGGLVKLSVPTARDLAVRFAFRDFDAPAGTARSLNPLHPLEHLQCFRESTLDAMAGAAGLLRTHVPARTELAFLRALRLDDFRAPAHVAKALVRPIRNAWSRHNLLAWYHKT